MTLKEFNLAGLNIRYVNFKKCIETSEMGKVEQSKFEAMKKQMETALLSKEKEINTLLGDLNDVEYMASLSPEAVAELKRKQRALTQEFGAAQQQFSHALQQSNFNLVQKMQQAVSAASNSVAKAQGIGMVINEDACFYKDSYLDITDIVVSEMNKAYNRT